MNIETMTLLMKIARQIKAEGDELYESIKPDDTTPQKSGKTAESTGFTNAALIVLSHIK